MASADLSCVSPPADGENSLSAGEFVLKKLFAEFVTLSDKKLQDIASQSPVSIPVESSDSIPVVPFIGRYLEELLLASCLYMAIILLNYGSVGIFAAHYLLYLHWHK